MMNLFLKILPLLIFHFLSGQTKPAETIYFKFNKYTITKEQETTIIDFINCVDTTKIESIQIFGYCDDRGKKNYNFILSNNRVRTVQKVLIDNGFNKNKLVVIEGKGRVLLIKDSTKSIEETRSKNRRVDLFLVKKNNFGKGIYNSFQVKHKVGDRIYLETVLFNMESSILTPQSNQELDKIAVLLQKHPKLQFEIRGHVCCTPKKFTDAIDRETGNRNLSVNRARKVYDYLLSKKINPNRMTYKGCGNLFPLGKGETLDRRVEFLILKT